MDKHFWELSISLQQQSKWLKSPHPKDPAHSLDQGPTVRHSDYFLLKQGYKEHPWSQIFALIFDDLSKFPDVELIYSLKSIMF
jgi:hypothetical protein